MTTKEEGQGREHRGNPSGPAEETQQGGLALQISYLIGKTLWFPGHPLCLPRAVLDQPITEESAELWRSRAPRRLHSSSFLTWGPLSSYLWPFFGLVWCCFHQTQAEIWLLRPESQTVALNFFLPSLEAPCLRQQRDLKKEEGCRFWSKQRRWEPRVSFLCVCRP